MLKPKGEGTKTDARQHNRKELDSLISAGGKGEHNISLVIFKASVLLAQGYAVLWFIYKTYKNVDPRLQLEEK